MRPCWEPSSSPLRSQQSGRQESNLPSTAYQTVASPIGFGPNQESRAGGGTRTHFIRVTRAVPGLSSIAGLSCAASASTWNRTRNSAFAEPRDVPFTIEARNSTPARSRTWTCSFGGSHDVPFTTRAWSSGGWDRTNINAFRARRPTVRRPRNERVTREGLEPSRHGWRGLLRTVCLPFHHLAICEQWTVEGVEPSLAGCRPAVFPLDDTPISCRVESVAQGGVEPPASLALDKGGLPVAYRAEIVRRIVKERCSGRRGSRTLKARRSSGFRPGAVTSRLALPLRRASSPSYTASEAGCDRLLGSFCLSGQQGDGLAGCPPRASCPSLT